MTWDNYGPKDVDDTGSIRQFSTGATRDTSQEKLDPYGFISPLALHRFSEYMHKHRLQSDGNLRSGDNWKKGMPPLEYIRSLVRHVFDFWLVVSGFAPRFDTRVTDPKEIACAILFNVQGYLHETLQCPSRPSQYASSEFLRQAQIQGVGKNAFVTGLSVATPKMQAGLHHGILGINEQPKVDSDIEEAVERTFRK